MKLLFLLEIFGVIIIRVLFVGNVVDNICYFCEMFLLER